MKRTFVAIALAALLTACSKEEAQPPARGPATPLDPAAAGTVSGRVTLSGTPPAETMLQMSGDATCAAAHSGKVPAGDVRVRDGKVEGAFVYVKSGLESFVFELPKEPVTIDQRGCVYVPRIVGAQTGQEIVFVNSDATLHNVHSQPKNSSGSNFGMAKQGSKRSIRVPKPEVMMGVKCDVHPWMRAHVGVLDHPYFAVTDAAGAFSLPGVPPGKYVLGVWHERFGEQSREIAVEPKAAVEASFEYAAK